MLLVTGCLCVCKQNKYTIWIYYFLGNFDDDLTRFYNVKGISFSGSSLEQLWENVTLENLIIRDKIKVLTR